MRVVRHCPYSELVLALGAELIRPPIGGDAADDVLGVNDLDDYRRFQDLLAAKGAKEGGHHRRWADRV